MGGIELFGADRTRQAAPNRVERVRMVRRCELGVLAKPFVRLFVVADFIVELHTGQKTGVNKFANYQYGEFEVLQHYVN